MVATHVSELAGVEQGSKSHIFFSFYKQGLNVSLHWELSGRAFPSH